jgi:cathepsin L
MRIQRCGLAVVLLVTVFAMGAARLESAAHPSRRHQVAEKLATPRWHELQPDYTYERYLADFGKTQLRANEIDARRAVFEEELASVIAHNSDERTTFKRGVNHFSDWTVGEKASQLLVDESQLQQQGNGHLTASSLPSRGDTTRGRRRAFDWRDMTPTVLTTVKDQGGCGSCWAHATVEAIETQVALNTGSLYTLSQQQFVSCVSNITVQPMPPYLNTTLQMGGCHGNFPHHAMQWMASDSAFKGGIAEEWANPYRDYYNGLPPFNASVGNTNVLCEAWMSAVPRPLANVTGFDWVKPNDGEAFEDAIINDGPVAVVIAVYQDFFSYESGLYSSAACEGKNGIMPPSHAINLIGFGHDDGANADFWTIRNSWSAAWGEHGYGRFLRPANETCGTMFLPTNMSVLTSGWEPLPACGMCGVLAYGVVPRAH